jgi:hypothetical protein
MATENLTDTENYSTFSNDIEYDVRVVRARAVAMRALVESLDGYDGNNDLLDLSFLLTSVANDLEGVADKLSDSSGLYVAKEVQHG